MRYITIHASLTPPDMDIGLAEIRAWHTDPPPRGNGWSDVGYHEIHRRNGNLELGRPRDRTGAHVGGHNTDNYGICLAGGLREGGSIHNPADIEDNFTEAQWKLLHYRMLILHRKWPQAVIMGHNGFPGHERRGCPCFDWRRWRDDFLAGLKETSPQLPAHWFDEVDVEGPMR